MFERIQLAILKRKIEAIENSVSNGDYYYSKEEYIKGFTLRQSDQDNFNNRHGEEFNFILKEEEVLDLETRGRLPNNMFCDIVNSDEYLNVNCWRLLTSGTFNNVNLHATNSVLFRATGTVEKLPEFMMDYVELIEDFRAEQCFNRNTLNNYEEYLKDTENNFMPFSYWTDLFKDNTQG